MKVLAVSKRSFQTALDLDAQGQFAKNSEVVELDGDFRRPDKSLAKKFNVVFSYHDLARSQGGDVITVLRRWKHLLKHDGSIQCFIPSVEWCAQQIAHQLLDPDVKSMWRNVLFGDQTSEEDINLSAFTLKEWRDNFQAAGLGVVAARTGQYEKTSNDSEVFYPKHHYIMAVKGRSKRA